MELYRLTYVLRFQQSGSKDYQICRNRKGAMKRRVAIFSSEASPFTCTSASWLLFFVPAPILSFLLEDVHGQSTPRHQQHQEAGIIVSLVKCFLQCQMAEEARVPIQTRLSFLPEKTSQVYVSHKTMSVSTKIIDTKQVMNRSRAPIVKSPMVAVILTMKASRLGNGALVKLISVERH